MWTETGIEELPYFIQSDTPSFTSINFLKGLKICEQKRIVFAGKELQNICRNTRDFFQFQSNLANCNSDGDGVNNTI